jgi:hypothetical protein
MSVYESRQRSEQTVVGHTAGWSDLPAQASTQDAAPDPEERPATTPLSREQLVRLRARLFRKYH